MAIAENQKPERRRINPGIEHTPAAEIRRRLTEAECAEADRQIKLIIDDRVRHSEIFKPAAIQVIAESILVQPTVEAVIMEGPPAAAEENRRLGLGVGITVGSAFASTVRDLRGVMAIRFIGQIFSQLQTRYRCILLRALGRRNDTATRRLSVRLHAADSSCVDSLDCDGQVYALADLPILPLPGCLTRQCPCSLELIDEQGHHAGAKRGASGGLTGRVARLFRKNG
ncbi:hypothetical protein [Hyphobacterium indicum]|uniref:hypothetical protein n=1 Tax=Hyphobacterium indicum TaxID=2162714 RepID=UPI000D64B4A6|nr:hypothetical protein [Hyphobacterium indicum]